MPAPRWRGQSAQHLTLPLSPCADLPDRLGTHKAPSGRLHVASKAASRWRVAEAQHSKWVRGMSEPPYGRHDGMARYLGGLTCHSTATKLPDSWLAQRLHVF